MLLKHIPGSISGKVMEQHEYLGKYSVFGGFIFLNIKQDTFLSFWKAGPLGKNLQQTVAKLVYIEFSAHSLFFYLVWGTDSKDRKLT